MQLDKFPKSVIEAYVVVLQDDGGVLPAAITCASLALADAGIDMYDMVASCSAGHVGDRVLVDPSKAEQQLYASQGVFGGVHMSYMASLRQVTHHSHTGSLPVEELEKLINLCMTG